jgi:hypothetical protein
MWFWIVLAVLVIVAGIFLARRRRHGGSRSFHQTRQDVQRHGDYHDDGFKGGFGA